MRFSRFTLGLLLCALAPQVGAAQGNQEQGSVAGEESTPSVEPSIAVLSIYSEEGDDDAAAKITAALRISIQQLGMGQLDSREVSLAQMSLAHGCATPDSQCMTKVADALKVDRVFYGTLHRRSESEGFLLSLRYFDRDIGAVVGSMEDELAPADLEGSAIETRAERYAAELAEILEREPSASSSTFRRPSSRSMDPPRARRTTMASSRHSSNRATTPWKWSLPIAPTMPGP